MTRLLPSAMMLLAPLALAACTGGEKADNVAAPNATSETANAAAPANVATPVPAADFARYVGHYPFDKVGDSSWHDDPAIVAAVTAAVGDKDVRKWVLEGDGPSTPIAMVDGRIASWACEAHNCGPHQWVTLVDPKSGAAEICYFDDEADADKARWFSAGKEETRAAPCPDVSE
ncbi:Ivy family c-type lysozyme inhibitor [Sphingobium sp.]|uniref:Ivy family c-type lysozyme inhibitor n=1 Tax=Sphingobium sp. TaxID=1912891 RepID=UPI002607EA81|nr:Ivy family c-type lysozyme inhibitor [Sphingobium sp.]